MRATFAFAAVLAGLALAGCGGGDRPEGAAEEQLTETGGVLGETAEQPIVDQPVTFELMPVGGSGVSGTVTMQAAEDDRDRTTFSIELSDAQTAAGTNPVELERGSCASLDAAEDVASLGRLQNGTLDEGVVTLSMLELLDGAFAVVVREESGQQASAIACADVPSKGDVGIDTGDGG